MMYAAKCYWPGVTHADLEQVAERAKAGPSTGSIVSYLGSLLFAADDLVLCLFQGPTRAAVIQASERLGIPSERLMDATWLGPSRCTREGAQKLYGLLCGSCLGNTLAAANSRTSLTTRRTP
jgi:hypothetical protein